MLLFLSFPSIFFCISLVTLMFLELTQLLVIFCLFSSFLIFFCKLTCVSWFTDILFIFSFFILSFSLALSFLLFFLSFSFFFSYLFLLILFCLLNSCVRSDAVIHSSAGKELRGESTSGVAIDLGKAKVPQCVAHVAVVTLNILSFLRFIKLRRNNAVKKNMRYSLNFTDDMGFMGYWSGLRIRI